MFKRPCSTLIKIYLSLFSVGFTAIHSPVHAQNNSLKGLPFITNYRYQDYGADGVNWWVEEDDQGVLYFANAQGILIYDGQRWDLVKPPGAPETRSLVKGADGKIYVGTNGDIGYLAPGKNGKLEFFSLKDKLPEDERLFAEVWETHEFQGEVYFRTNNKVFIWDLKSFRILESQEGFHVGSEVNGQYYVRIWARGLTVLKKDSFHLVPNGEKFANERIYVILPYDDKRILIGARTQGMFIYDGKEFTPFKTEADPFIVNTSLYGGRILSNGLIALNTFNDGMAIIDKQGKLIQRIDKSVGLQDNSVDQVFEDSRGILWMPLFNGIAKFDLRSSLTFYNDALGLPSKTVFSVGTNNNQIYAGSNNGIYTLNSVTNRFEKVQGSGGQTGNFLTNGKDLLVSGAENGLLKLEGNKAIAVIPGINYDFHLRSIIRSKLDTTVLYCALRSGLAIVRYSPSTGDYAVESFAPILNQSATLVSETSAGNLWMNGDDIGQIKLVKPDRSNRKWVLNENSVEVFDSRHGLPRKNIAMMEYDSKVYFATETDSIYLFNEAQQRFVRDTGVILNQQFVLFADYTLLGISDPLGRIWANFGQGVFVANPAEGGGHKIVNAPFKELRKNYPIWDIALSTGSQGEVIAWMSGREGIIRYDGNLELTAQDQFSCILRGITLNEDSVYFAGFGLTHGKAEFSNSWNTVQFDYAAPFFKLENETQFSSILEGRDKHWSDWDKQNFREFGNLPAGLYTFRVKAKNIYDTESSEASFTFNVLPPWYSTWWAYLLYTLLAGALIYAIVRWRTNQLHEKHRELEIMVNERTAELKLRVDELAVINSVQEGLASKLDLQAIYDLVGDKIRDVFDAQGVAISFLDRATNQINNPYYLFEGKRINQPAFEFGKGMTSKVIRDGQPLLINEKAADRFKEYGAVFASSETEISVKSWLGVPLISAGKVNGIIKLENYNKEFAYTEGDVSLLQTLANSMSVALENARLFDETNRLLKETEQRTGELAVINSVQEGLAREIDIQSIYEMVGDRIKDLFNAQAVLIASFDHETGMEHFNYQNGTKGKVYPKPRAYDKLRQHLIDTKQLILINEKTEEAAIQFGLHVIAGTDFPKSMVFTPLSIGDKVNGYISLQNISHENAFSEADVRLLSTISNSMSVALENARLFDETNRLLKETEQRTAELAVINSVQEGLARELDMQGIYDLVGERIRLLFDAQAVVIATLDLDQRSEHFKYAIENGERFYPNPRPYDKLRQRLVEIKQKIVINTGEEAFSWFGQKVLPGTKTMKSGVFVPLILGEKITSYISLQNVDKEYAFSVSDIRLLETLANSMSVALENARLFDETNRLLKETEQRTGELAVINSVQEGLARELDLQGIYNLIGDRVQQLFNAQAVIIASLDLESNTEHFNYVFENNEKVKIGSRPINKLRQLLIDRKQVIYIATEYQAMNDYGLSAIEGTQMPKSLLFVPMLTGNTIKGYVSLQNIDLENAFSSSDIRLLETLANSMSVALENARLFDETNRLLKETEQRTAELAVINSVQDGLAKELDIRGIYNLVGDRLCELFPDSQTLVIRTFEHETSQEHWQYAKEKGVRQYVHPRPFNWNSKQLILSKKPLDIKENYIETAVSFGGTGVTAGQPPKSALFVPMIVGELVKGSISLQNVDTEFAFNESDLRLLTTLTNSMSVALENARLFDETNRLLKETEQRTAELAVINSVQEGLARELDMQGIYDLIGDRVQKLFNAQAVIIATLDLENRTEHFNYIFENNERVKLDSRPFSKLRQLLVDKKHFIYIASEEQARNEYGVTAIAGTLMPKSLLFVPMLTGNIIKGYVSLQNMDIENAFSHSDIRLLETLANSMSVALENARLFDETNRLLKETEQRTAELAVINSVQEGLAKELDMRGIYDLVGDRLCELFPDTQTLVIRTFDHESGIEHFQYAIEKGNRLSVDSQPFIWASRHLIEDRKAIHINENYLETSKKFGGTGVTIGQPPKSAVFVPMLVGDLVKGSISLQNVDRENAFSDSDLRLLTTITNSMSVALENARLFDETNRLLKETEQRTAELAVINSVQDGLVREMDINAIYELVGKRLCDLFNTQTVLIRTFDHSQSTEIWRYVIEKGERHYSEPRPLIWANKYLIRHLKPLLINENYLETSKKYGGSGVSMGLPPKSAVFVPMIVGDIVKGSVSLQNVESENAFSESDLRLLTTITNSMSVALENARLFDETTHLLAESKQRAAELSTVNSISRALASQLDPDDLINLVGDQLKDLFKANIVYLALLNNKTNIIDFPYQFGEVMPSRKIGEGLTSKIIMTGEPLLINKDMEESAAQLGIQHIGLVSASYLGVPIPVGDKIIGVLSVQSTEQENRFNENDLRLLSTIASSVGVALNNATLFEEVKMAKQEAETASLLAEKANEAKSAFLSTVSHELRTPLTSVLGFAKIIKKRLEERIFPATNISDPKTEKAIQQVSDNLNVVVSEGQRLTSLINDVLDLAKIEAGKMQWNQENVSLQEVADRAIAATTSLFDQKSLLLVKDIDDQIPGVIGDKDKLIQVMVNLISNSVKFTPEGTVTCKIYRYEDEVRVSISDTGIGIAPKDHAAVFEQFKQVGDTLTDKPKGTGLGLPICKEIVEHHGGRIWLESELGKGSTFIFALPLKQANLPKTVELDDLVKQLKEQVAQSQLNVHGQAANILIVDDDDSIRSLLQQELGEAGYQIDEARNGKEALAKVREHRPDLILLDIMMPEMNGFDVAAVLKNDPQTMDIPIIVLSIVQDKARGFKIGVDRYLSKPIDTGILFNEIGSLLEQGKSKKKVMIVDEDSGTVNTLTEVLKTKGYLVMESNGKELVENALAHQPDIIIINSVLSGNQEMVKTLRFENGMEDVLFLLYQ